jgi:hypothetical protein
MPRRSPYSHFKNGEMQERLFVLSSARPLLPASFNRALPERTRPANSFASGDSAFSGLPGPLRLSNGEVIFPTKLPQLRLGQDARGEGIVLGEALGQLLLGQDGQIHRPAKLGICRPVLGMTIPNMGTLLENVWRIILARAGHAAHRAELIPLLGGLK